MVDQIYSLFTWQGFILAISLFINLGLAVDYIDKKLSKKGRKKKCLKI